MKLLLVIATVCVVTYAGKVDPSLQIAVENGVTDAILELPQIVGQIENNPALQSLSGAGKVSALVATLQGLTSAAQAPLVTVAKSLDLETEQYWASNIILVKGLTLEKLLTLANTPGDFTLREQHVVSINSNLRAGRDLSILQNPQWGVAKIRAPEAWSITDGAGAVVGFMDSGVNLAHEALTTGYAGAWLDPYYNTADPTDQNGFGSHTAGVVVGRTNGIGVAPGAQWVACRGLNHQGSGTEAALVTCGQFMMTANPKPNVVSNGWGGGSGSTWFNPVITGWRNAGIIPVFGVGNSGPNCGTIGSPGDNANVVGVAASTDTDAIATFASRGPGAGGLLKPDFAAPGSNTLSAGTGSNNYVTMSGNGAVSNFS